MICFGNANIDWEAVSAVGTLLASLIALFASWLAVKAPEWSKHADWKNSTGEVLKATQGALLIYNEARALTSNNNVLQSENVKRLRIRADHLKSALEVLLTRPSLSDGAIVLGSGCVSFLAALQNLNTVEEYGRNQAFFGDHDGEQALAGAIATAKAHVERIGEIVTVVTERMVRVENYMVGK
jgi:hypothetical protein